MSMKNEISFWPSRFASLRDTVPVPTTWGDLVEEIRGGRHLTVTRSLSLVFTARLVPAWLKPKLRATLLPSKS